MIWIGSFIPAMELNNMYLWLTMNQSCDLDIYLWYDSEFDLKPDNTPHDRSSLNTLLSYQLNTINGNFKNKFYLKDIREDEALWLGYENLKDFYEMEVGLKYRPHYKTQEISNWGLGTDILRLLILRKYGGFYCDVDINPVDLCSNIKLCIYRFCVGYMDGSAINSVLYYDPKIRLANTLIEKYLQTISDKYDSFYDTELLYLTSDYVNRTIDTTGPSSFPVLLPQYCDDECQRMISELPPNNNGSELYIYGFSENEEMGSSHTWFVKPSIKSKIWYDILTIPPYKNQYLSEQEIVADQKNKKLYPGYKLDIVRSLKTDYEKITKQELRATLANISLQNPHLKSDALSLYREVQNDFENDESIDVDDLYPEYEVDGDIYKIVIDQIIQDVLMSHVVNPSTILQDEESVMEHIKRLLKNGSKRSVDDFMVIYNNIYQTLVIIHTKRLPMTDFNVIYDKLSQ